MSGYVAVLGSNSTWVNLVFVIVIALLPASIMASTCESEPGIKKVTAADLATADAKGDAIASRWAYATRQAFEKRIATLEAQGTRVARDATQSAIDARRGPRGRYVPTLAPRREPHPWQPNPRGVFLTATARSGR